MSKGLREVKMITKLHLVPRMLSERLRRDKRKRSR